MFAVRAPLVTNLSCSSNDSSSLVKSSSPISSIAQKVLSLFSPRSKEDMPFNEKAITHVDPSCSINMENLPSNGIYTEVFGQGSLERVFQNGSQFLAFSHDESGEKKSLLFANAEDLDVYLSSFCKGPIFWQIKEVQADEISFKRFSQGEVHTFKSQELLFAFIFKEKGPFFKTSYLGEKLSSDAYILKQSGFFNFGYAIFNTEEELHAALGEQIKRASSIQKVVYIAGALASLGALAAYYTPYEETEEETPLTRYDVAMGSAVVIGRRLLSDVAGQLPSLIATEESFFEFKNYTWDFFKNSDGSRITVSAQQANGLALPNGLSLVNLPIQTVGSYPIPSCNVIAYRDHIVYIGTGTGLRVLDVKDPQNPVFISFVFMSGVKSITLSGRYLYAVVIDFPTYDFVVIDILDPTSLKQVSSTPLEMISMAPVAVSANYTFVAGYTNTPAQSLLKILDTTAPSNVTTIASLALPGTTLSSIFVEKNTCYIGGNGGFFIVDVSDPLNPTLSGSLQTIGAVNKFAIKDKTALIATASNGLGIFNISNPQQILPLNTLLNGQSISQIKCSSPYCFMTVASNLLQKIDITEMINPLFVSSVPSQLLDLSISEDYLYVVDSTGLKVNTLGDVFSLKGSPSGGTAGNYSIRLSGKGTLSSVEKTALLEIQPAITLIDLVPDQTVIVGSSLIYNINAFKQANGNPLTFAAELDDSKPLPSWLSLNPASGALSGTPQETDTGTLKIKLTAFDTLGAKSFTSFSLFVVKGVSLNQPLINQAVTIGLSFTYTIGENTFLSKDGLPLVLEASSGLKNLPSWLTFDPLSQTFSGTPSKTDSGTTLVTVTAQDPLKTKATSSFEINVVQEIPPVIKRVVPSQTASVGTYFFLSQDAYAFHSDSTSHITYTFTLDDGGELPSWLSVDPLSGALCGTPSLDDMGLYFDKSLSIKVTAKGVDLIGQSTFTIDVTGFSYGKILTLAGSICGTALTAALSIPKLKKYYWNYFKRPQIQEATLIAPGDPFFYAIKMPKKEVTRFVTRSSGKQAAGLSQLPQGFYYDRHKNSIIAPVVPVLSDLGDLVIEIEDAYGRVKESFKLSVKPGSSTCSTGGSSNGSDTLAEFPEDKGAVHVNQTASSKNYQKFDDEEELQENPLHASSLKTNDITLEESLNNQIDSCSERI